MRRLVIHVHFTTVILQHWCTISYAQIQASENAILRSPKSHAPCGPPRGSASRKSAPRMPIDSPRPFTTISTRIEFVSNQYFEGEYQSLLLAQFNSVRLLVFRAISLHDEYLHLNHTLPRFNPLFR